MKVADFEVDLCRVCEGVWLQKGELKRLLTLSRGEVAASPVVIAWHGASSRPQGDAARGLFCPECMEPMRCYRFGGDRDVYIDGCPEGCGVWADDGELRRMHQSLHKSAPLEGSAEDKALFAESPAALRGLAEPLLRAIDKPRP